MDTLPKLYPNVADLLAMRPEDLVPIFVSFALRAEKLQGSRFQIAFVDQIATKPLMTVPALSPT